MAGDAHGHDHDGHGHSHAIADDANPRWLAYALAVNLAYMFVEIAAGIIGNSLALLSDAVHMLTDAGAIGLALFAAHIARRRPGGSMTYGYRRAEILSALVNGTTLLLLAVWLVVESVQRLGSPEDVDAPLMFVVGLSGLFVNLLAAVFLAKANRTSLNVDGAFKHNLTDAYASVGTAVAAVIIWTIGFDRADPIASLSAHVTVALDTDCHAVRRELERLLHDEFDLEHTTLQVDHAGGELLTIQPAADTRPAGE